MEETLVYKKIIALLQDASVSYESYSHEHVHHSHEAATIRGTRLEEAAKALVLETGSKKIFMCIVSGHRKIDLKKLKQLLGEKDIHLAHPDKVLDATGCPIGSVPPFGNLFHLETYCDVDVLSRDHVVFSAGSHHHSVRMLGQDWTKIVAPHVVDIGKYVE
jgi:Ala-tRNA(Pro) deacylase